MTASASAAHDDRRRAAALAVPAAERVSLTASFFSAHRGGGAGKLGLGRAVADFVAWEIGSGRLADIGGSPWWRVANGAMMLDLRDAAALLAAGAVDAAAAAGASATTSASPGVRPVGARPSAAVAAGARPSAAVAAWVGYTAEPGGEVAQAAMWDAHQLSLADGARLAEPLLDHEAPEEQAFCRIVLEVVEHAAARRTATDADELARLTERSYPAAYPITAEQLDTLVTRLRRAG